MPQLAQASPDRVAAYFVAYLFKQYGGSQHVRRVAAWIGLIVLGLKRLGVSWWLHKQRQLFFEHNGHRYKVKYNHQAGPRGGVEIIEVRPSPGSPEVRTVETLTRLSEVERFYRKCARRNPNWP
jgi:hypothetical protein